MSTLVFVYNPFSYAALTLSQDVADLKNRVKQLEHLGPGIPTNVVDHYLKTGDCTALTTQPTDACTVSGTCYDTDAFADSNAVSLIGQTFTAIKTTADATDKDGGIWLCDSGDLSGLLVITQCTSIGGNRRDGSKTVEFTIPVGALDKRIYALSMSAAGLITTQSTLTSISVCKKVSVLGVEP